MVESKGTSSLVNMIGFNFRMTEIEAVIAREQLKKLKWLVEERRRNVAYLENNLADISFLSMPKVRDGCEHSYYIHAMRYNELETGVNREKFVEAVKAELMPIELRETEGVKVGLGYLKPLYEQPLFKQKVAYGNNGYPFRNSDNYKKVNCPVCDRICHSETIFHELMRPYICIKDLDDVVEAFHKVAKHMDELK